MAQPKSKTEIEYNLGGLMKAKRVEKIEKKDENEIQNAAFIYALFANGYKKHEHSWKEVFSTGDPFYIFAECLTTGAVKYTKFAGRLYGYELEQFAYFYYVSSGNIQDKVQSLLKAKFRLKIERMDVVDHPDFAYYDSVYKIRRHDVLVFKSSD